MHAERPGFVRRRGDHATTDIIAQTRKAPATIGLHHRPIGIAPPDHDRLPPKLRITQQLNRCEEGIHIEVGNPTNTVHAYSMTGFSHRLLPPPNSYPRNLWISLWVSAWQTLHKADSSAFFGLAQNICSAENACGKAFSNRRAQNFG